MIKKILVYYENSRPAEHALNYTVNLVKNIKEHQKEIILLHVIKPYDDSMKSFFIKQDSIS